MLENLFFSLYRMHSQYSLNINLVALHTVVLIQEFASYHKELKQMFSCGIPGSLRHGLPHSILFRGLKCSHLRPKKCKWISRLENPPGYLVAPNLNPTFLLT